MGLPGIQLETSHGKVHGKTHLRAVVIGELFFPDLSIFVK